MPARCDLLLQKHNNVHKAFCTITVGWLAAPIVVLLSFNSLAKIVEEQGWIKIQSGVGLFILAYAIVMIFILMKMAEYEDDITNTCP